MFGYTERYTDLNGDDRPMMVFGDIPYAEPPVGPLRLRPPVPLSKEKGNCWKGTYAAVTTSIYKGCPQLYQGDLYGQEDCLYLNVRTPSREGKRPVLVWIHGGSFIEGNKDWWGASPDGEFTSAMDVVTVSFNYRLGMLGFLTVDENWITKGKNVSYSVT